MEKFKVVFGVLFLVAVFIIQPYIIYSKDPVEEVPDFTYSDTLNSDGTIKCKNYRISKLWDRNEVATYLNIISYEVKENGCFHLKID